MPKKKEDFQKIKEIKDEQEISELEQDVEEAEETIDTEQFTEFLQPSIEINVKAPVLERIANAQEETIVIQGIEGQEEEKQDEDLNIDYIEGLEKSKEPGQAGEAKYVPEAEGEIKYLGVERIKAHPNHHVDPAELGRDPASLIHGKIRSIQSSELKNTGLQMQEDYATAQRRDTESLGKEEILEELKSKKVKYESGV
ncbi:hypothetical protein ACFLZJ_00600 [Nanoarchaeota archaeon]